MTNQTDLVRVKVRLNQVISNGTGGPGSNVPTGLTMTNDGSLVTTAPGTITSGNQNFSLESPITKDVTTPWEAGSNKGGLLTSTRAQTEKLNAFVISTGVVYDIAFTFDDTPTLPTGYNLYAKIGHVLLNEGAITELWPTKDLGTSWVDNDIYAAINETNTRVTANSDELTNVKADIVDINTSVEGLDTATSEIQAKIPAEASETNQLADKAFVNEENAKNKAALELKADKADTYTKTEVDTFIAEQETNLNTVKNDLGDLGEQVSVIESKIPAEASDSNQLADKAFVNEEVGKINFVKWVTVLPNTGETKYLYAIAREEQDLEGHYIAALYVWDGSAWRGAGGYSLNINPADFALKTDLDNLGNQVSVIESKIPAEASDTNQLADKQFVQDLTSALNFVTWVDALPETGESKYIYAVPREETDTDGKQIAALYLWDGTRWNGAGAFSLNIDPDTLATKAELAGYLPLRGGKLSGNLYGVRFYSDRYSFDNGSNVAIKSEGFFMLGDNSNSLVLNTQDERIRFRKKSTDNTQYFLLSELDKSVANGVASLDANAKIPAAQIPVDGTTITVNEEGNLVSAGGSGGDAMAVVKLTQAEYDALNPKDPSTIYAIKMEEE